MVVVLALLFLAYNKASRFLSSSDAWNDEPVEKEMVEIASDEAAAVESPKARPEKTMTYSLMSNEPLDSETELIADATMGLMLQYMSEKRHLIGQIEYLQDLKITSKQKMNRVRFHVTLLPAKKVKFTTDFRPFQSGSTSLYFELRGLKPEELQTSQIRFRLFGYRTNFGMPVRSQKCLGEIFVGLDKFKTDLEAGIKIRTKYAILPKGNTFSTKAKK